VDITNRTIFLLWWQGFANAPPLVRACIESWRRFHPDWRVVALDAHTIGDWIALDDMIDLARPDIPLQKVANVARLALLRAHGGVWADATLYCLRPLDEWLPRYHTIGLTAFRNPTPDRMIATWFFAADKDNAIVAALLAEFVAFLNAHRFPNQGTDESMAEIDGLMPALGKDVKSTLGWFEPGLIERLGAHPYFILHYIFNRLMLDDARLRALWDSAPALDIGASGRLRKLADRKDGLERALALIDRGAGPVQKLDWRVDATTPFWTGVLARLAAIGPAPC
jgi:hypothetical protein